VRQIALAPLLGSRTSGGSRQGVFNTLIGRLDLDLFHKDGVHANSLMMLSRRRISVRSSFITTSGKKEGLVHEVLQTHLEAIGAGSAPLKYDVESYGALEHCKNGSA
jgi:hypothetical protein